jgi:uncharacterized protein
MRAFTKTLAAAVLAALALLPGAARAQTAEEILAKADQVTNGYADQYMRNIMTIIDIDGSQKSYDFSIAQKGEKRMIRFHSGEMKGMANLIEDAQSIYAYLPGFKKIRRVAAHNMNQSFAGSDFTNDLMAFTSWVKAYQPKLEREDADYWYLSCTPRAGGVKPPFPKAEAKVNKKNSQLDAYAFFDEAGQKVKTFENSDLKDFGGGAVRNTNILVTDTRTGHKTRLDIKEFKVNQGLKDDLFTQRELEWGK